MNQHLLYTYLLELSPEERPLEEFLSGETRIGTWVNFGQTHSNARTWSPAHTWPCIYPASEAFPH